MAVVLNVFCCLMALALFICDYWSHNRMLGLPASLGLTGGTVLPEPRRPEKASTDFGITESRPGPPGFIPTPK